VEQNVTNAVAILNTHGHFDHIWSNEELRAKLNVKVYVPKDDAVMLTTNQFGHNQPLCNDFVKVNEDEELNLNGIKAKFWHFPGHTPGCSAIQIQDKLFSGDFIFKNSIGRVDLPLSSPSHMTSSIQKFLKFQDDLEVFPGHGDNTTVKAEQKNLPMWLNYI
jgi:glyoxylase-like metal-dependent hydrolase (beta-lactamase superfamily II)